MGEAINKLNLKQALEGVKTYVDSHSGDDLTIDLNNPCSFNEFTAAFGKKPVWINGLLVVGYVDENEDVVIYTTAYKTNSSAVYYYYYSFTSADHTQPMVYNSRNYSEMTPDFATSIGSTRASANIHKNNDWLTMAHDSSTDLVDTRFKQGANQLDIQIPTKKYVDDNTDGCVKWNNTRTDASGATLTSYRNYSGHSGAGLFQVSTGRHGANGTGTIGDMEINAWVNKVNNGGPQLDFYVCEQDDGPMVLRQSVDLSDTGWQALNINPSITEAVTAAYRKKNGIVYFKIHSHSLPIGDQTTAPIIATLPAGFRPTANMYNVGTTTNFAGVCGITIETNGNIRVCAVGPTGTTATGVAFDTSYPV